MQFLLNNFNNIHYIDSIDIKLNEKNVSCFKKGYLCFGGKYSDYEIVNIISNLKYEVGTFDIIKLSQSI